MKTKRLVILCVLAVILANCVLVSAIGFDAEEVYNSVFVIRSGSALGSGYAIGESYVVTNAHVIDNPKRVQVTGYDDNSYSARVVAMDSLLDIALLYVTDSSFTPLPKADMTALKTGDDVYAIGAPKSFSYTLTKGVVSAKVRVHNNQTFVQTDAAINSGNSGGPLLNDSGQVVGVNTYKIDDSEGMGLAIPIDVVLDYLTGEGVLITAEGIVDEAEQPTYPAEGDFEGASEGYTDIDYPPGDYSIPPLPSWVYPIIGLIVAVIVLTIILLFRSKRNIYLPDDPSARTDFEIDILE